MKRHATALTCGLSNALTAAAAEPPPAKPTYDCIVLGLGAMGPACVYQLAKRGSSVLGLEQFDIAHALASSGVVSEGACSLRISGGVPRPVGLRATSDVERGGWGPRSQTECGGQSLSRLADYWQTRRVHRVS